MSYHRFIDMSSSSPEVEVSAPQAHGNGVNGYGQYTQGSSTLAELSAIFPNLDIEVLSSALRAQAGSVEAVVEYLLSGKSLTEVGRQEMEDPLIKMVGKFSRKIGGLPEVLPAVSSEYQVVEEHISVIHDQVMCGDTKVQSGDLIVADGVLPLREVEDRQALLKGTEEEVDAVPTEAAMLTQPSNYSTEGRVTNAEDVDKSSGSDSEEKKSLEEILREEEEEAVILQKSKMSLDVM